MLLTLASNPALMRSSSMTAYCERQVSWHKSDGFFSLPQCPQDPGQARMALSPPSVLLLVEHYVRC